MTLSCPRGIGDVCVSLPACYAFAEKTGEPVFLRNADAPERQWASRLPTYCGVASAPEGEPADVDFNQALDFSPEMDFFQLLADRAGLLWEALQPAPWLRIPDRTAAVPDGDYILVCPQGSQVYRTLLPEQVAPLCDEWRVVISHHKPLPDWPGENLSGQLEFEDLVSLMAHATCVVATDSGPLHMAGAFCAPTVAVVGHTLNPLAFAAWYKPSLWLQGGTAQSVSPEAVSWGVGVVTDARPELTPLGATGDAWWQSAEVQTRRARAAAHQAAIIEEPSVVAARQGR